LASIVDKFNEEDNAKADFAPRVTDTGLRTFKTDGEIVFVTQAESYYNRGSNFVDFSPLEFECIVDVVLVATRKVTKKSGAGRPARDEFAFGPDHPLLQTHVGVIRAKFLTPVFGGAPPPTWRDTLILAMTRASAMHYLSIYYVHSRLGTHGAHGGRSTQQVFVTCANHGIEALHRL
jgi:hypothetical protein